MKKLVMIGMVAGLLLVLLYFGILSLAQGVAHALDQMARMWYWILALAGGFGIQVSLFWVIRQGLQNMRRTSTTATVATSGGISTGSMAACCAHHLSEVLPFIGLSSLAAFLVGYQTLFIVIGVLSNMVGITIMLETIQRYGLCPVLTRLRFNLGKVKKGAMISAAVISLVVFLFTLSVS